MYNGKDILGIDYGQIDGCQTAIEQYIAKVNEVTSKITADAGQVQYQQGIQGEQQKAALEGYVTEAVEKIHTVTDELKKFSDALEQVKVNYETQQGNVAGDMGTVQDVEITAKTGVSGFGD